MRVTSTKNYSFSGISCGRCHDALIAPTSSQYVSARQVRHAWSCENCGHQFETSDYLRCQARPTTRRKVAQPIPLLVA
jgi:hypothetical protein